MRHDDDDDEATAAASEAAGVPEARTRGLACKRVCVDDGADRGRSIGSGSDGECGGAAVKVIVGAAMRAGRCGAGGGVLMRTEGVIATGKSAFANLSAVPERRLLAGDAPN